MSEYNFKFDWNRISTLGKVRILVEQVVGSPSQAQISQAVADYIDSHPGALSPLSQATKSALLDIAEHVAYIDANGQSYYNALDAALNAKALLSITAVYTQSGTVYDTDSLDSLKADLVVTAYYDDGTTADVTSASTLSGTLAEGTSTITVTYQEKTATFTVTVSDIPEYGTFTPDNYVQGYYIESDGTVTASQYGSMSETYYAVRRGVLNFACSTNFRVSLYDSAKNFLRQVIFTTDGTAYNQGNGKLRSRDAAITFDDDVKYFRLSWSAETNVEFTVTNTEYTDLYMEIGDIDSTTGEETVHPLRIRSVDYIPVSSTSFVIDNFRNSYNTRAFLDSTFMTKKGYGFLGRCYDSSKTVIGSISWTTENSTVTLPTGTAYVRPIIQFGNVNIPDDFAKYQWIPLILNSVKYRIVKA